MGLFKKRQMKIRTISAKDIVKLIKMAVEAIDDFQIEYEIPFSYMGNEHIIGIDYDRDNAPKGKYDPAYMSVYIDDQHFRNPEDILTEGILDGYSISDISNGILVDENYLLALDQNDIELDVNDAR